MAPVHPDHRSCFLLHLHLLSAVATEQIPCTGRGASASLSSSAAVQAMNADVNLFEDFNDGYHCPCVEQHIPACFISLYLTDVSPNIMQSYATFDSLIAVKRLILMDLNCSGVSCE